MFVGCLLLGVHGCLGSSFDEGEEVTIEGNILPFPMTFLRSAIVLVVRGVLVGRAATDGVRGVCTSGVRSSSRNFVRTSLNAFTHA